MADRPTSPKRPPTGAAAGAAVSRGVEDPADHRDLAGSVAVCRLLADPTRVRLLKVLGSHALTVAELTQATRLPQPRVSTHLRKLREAGLVEHHRVAGQRRYRWPSAGWSSADTALIQAILDNTADPLLTEDARRARAAVAARHRGSWVDGVAGRMARHYSPGRTWEALARTLAGTARVGRVIDIGSGDGAVAELLAPFAQHITCIDNNARVVAAGQDRLAHLQHLTMGEGDMHALPFDGASFDLALVLGALQYTDEPEQVLCEAARVLRPGGRIVVSTLRRHVHAPEVEPFGHSNLGHEPAELSAMLAAAGLTVERCAVVAREHRAPHFEVVAATALR